MRLTDPTGWNALRSAKRWFGHFINSRLPFVFVFGFRASRQLIV